jgi:asparagine synthetase B (glutamine-hydrolysing)
VNGDPTSLAESGHLPFILRTLFHRNDSLGMSTSIEARYPVLSRDLLRFAINLPTRAKIRMEPRWIDWHHLFLRDKWVWRQLAKRYLPRPIAEQKKKAFHLPVIHRIAFDARFFQDSVLRDWYRVSERQMRCLVEQSSPQLKLRMASADIWGRMFFRGETAASVTQHMMPFVSIAGSRLVSNRGNRIASGIRPSTIRQRSPKLGRM